MKNSRNVKHYLPWNYVIAFAAIMQLFQIVEASAKDGNKRKVLKADQGGTVVINTDKLDLFLQSNALATLLKAKADSIFSSNSVMLPMEERIVYEQCANSVTTVIELARCVSSLLRKRDSMLYSKQESMDKYNEHEEQWSWLKKLQNWFWPFDNMDRVANIHKNEMLNTLNNNSNKEYEIRRSEFMKEDSLLNNTNNNKVKMQQLVMKTHNKFRLLNKFPGVTHINFQLAKVPCITLPAKSIRTPGMQKKKKIFPSPTQRTNRFHHRIRKKNWARNLSQLNIYPIKRIKRSTRWQFSFQTEAPPTEVTEFEYAQNANVTIEADSKNSTELTIYNKPFNDVIGETTYKQLNFERPTKRKITLCLNNRIAFRQLHNCNVSDTALKPDLLTNTPKKLNLQVNSETFTSAVHQIRSEKMITSENSRRSPTIYKNIQKIKEIQNYLNMVKHCDHYMKDISEDNTEYLKTFDDGYDYITSLESDKITGNTEQIVSDVEKELKKIETIPVLSPKLFSIIPEDINPILNKSSSKNLKSNIRSFLLSPNLFSFHDEGFLSLSSLFKLLESDEKTNLDIIENTLKTFGIGRTLNKIIKEIAPKMGDLKKIYSTILHIQELQNRWNKVRLMLSDDQKNMLRKLHYVLLNDKQYQTLHSVTNTESTRFKKDIDSVESINILDEDALEHEIHLIAELLEENVSLHSSRSNRVTRRAPMLPDSYDINERNKSFKPMLSNTQIMERIKKIRLLRQFSFGNRLRDGVAMNSVILSPSAFTPTVLSAPFGVATILSPRFFGTMTISPRAALLFVLSPQFFIANTLSPFALWFDTLSPRFFQLNALAPRAFVALIMSPRTMLFDVLSPKAFELKVMSPSTFFVLALSPFFFHSRVFSPPTMGLIALSPSFLSPSINSKAFMTVQVLSPKILSPDIDLKDIDLKSPDKFWKKITKPQGN